uniref:Uncharacterized protein n=1 Tax=Solanum lycopersicum TaxID=4081 RepID=A0A3Q7ENA1_SOLLC
MFVALVSCYSQPNKLFVPNKAVVGLPGSGINIRLKLGRLTSDIIGKKQSTTRGLNNKFYVDTLLGIPLPVSPSSLVGKSNVLPVANELMNARVISCIGFGQLPNRTFNTLVSWCIYFANSTKLISVWMWQA